jgi:hypothetical protein
MFLLKGWDISGMQPRSQGAVRAGRFHPTSLIKAYTLRTAVQLLKSIGLCNHPYMLLSDRVYLFKILAVLHGHSRKAAVWKGDKHFHFQNVRLSHITQVLQSFHQPSKQLTFLKIKLLWDLLVFVRNFSPWQSQKSSQVMDPLR